MNAPTPTLASFLRFFLPLLLIVPGLAPASTPATWSTGHKKVLIIPFRFSDLPGPFDTPSANGTSTSSSFFQRRF